MAYSHYDRLSSLDATFLQIESPSVHMHIGAVAIFEVSGGGPPDPERMRALTEASLSRSPRLRQRLEPIPRLGHWVWVDDERFQLDYHLRHTALPAPGDLRQLKRLAGRIFSQKLDLHRPAWEMWLVEGLEDGRFALISKMHHCMVDGLAGVDLVGNLVAAARQEGAPPRWLPRPAPGPRTLLADELAHRAALPARALRAGLRALGSPRDRLREARHGALSVAHALGAATGSASATPLNDPIGPYRRFDWHAMDLSAIREVRERLGGTVNDVVLAIVAGAMRHFLERRGLAVDELDFRAMVPVSRRGAAERGRLGNRVVSLVAGLPVDEADPARRMARVIATTRALKRSDLVSGNDLVMEFADATLTTLVAQLSRLAARARAYNVVVTNVPGLQQSVELLDGRLCEVYPLVPLFSNQGLGIALLSYDGRLFWGFNADWDALPDLHDLVGLVAEELEVLRKLSGASA
jgi:WS/DGAT/MGAT family acyltransferase